MRVLAAVSRGRERLFAVLGADHVVWADTIQDVVSALDRGAFDMVIIGASFDDSRALEALRHAVTRADRSVLVCVRAARFEQLGEASFAAFVIACEETGADCVLDLSAFPDDDAGNARARQVLRRIVVPVMHTEKP